MGNPKYLTIKQHAANYSQSKEEKQCKSENILAAIETYEDLRGVHLTDV